MLRRVLLGFACLVSGLFAQADWNDPFPPHRIADNLYYVGSKGLSSYLITSDAGHILINSSFDRTVPLIRKSVEQLGFKFTDIKILLDSHAHGDHVEGTALVKELSGCKVYVMKGDEKAIEDGGKSQYLYKKDLWKPCKVDRVLHDGDVITVGKMSVKAVLTAGHTPGCTTFVMKATDQGKTYDVVIVGSPNVNPGYQLVGNKEYPGIAEDFARQFKTLLGMHCDIFLGAHGLYYNLEEKYARLKKDPKTNPFVDPEGYKAYITERQGHYRKELAAQRKK